MFTEADTYFMRQALKEARKGRGYTSPNPCVGAVIVRDGSIIARGYHRKAGTPHAEINALRQAGPQADGATIYVTLEPCCHTGRTGPCCPALEAAGIREVVIGMLDPNPNVDGRGAHYLRERGIRVRCGLLERACFDLNRAFFKYIRSGLPLIVLKAGLSLDGKITLRAGRGDPLTGPKSWRRVHWLRHVNDAILVGLGTVRTDNPTLTARLPRRRPSNPVRVVLDTRLRVDETSTVVTGASTVPTWIFCANTVDEKKLLRLAARGARVHPVDTGADGRVDLHAVVQTLGANQITSVLVEGGAAVHGAFLEAGLVDEVQLFFAPIIAGAGGLDVIRGYRRGSEDSRPIRLERVHHERLGDDVLISGDVVYP